MTKTWDCFIYPSGHFTSISSANTFSHCKRGKSPFRPLIFIDNYNDTNRKLFTLHLTEISLNVWPTWKLSSGWHWTPMNLYSKDTGLWGRLVRKMFWGQYPFLVFYYISKAGNHLLVPWVWLALLAHTKHRCQDTHGCTKGPSAHS